MTKDKTVKCATIGCRNRITPPHIYNNFDLWCGFCHAASRPKPDLAADFQLRVARHGHQRRGNYRDER